MVKIASSSRYSQYPANGRRETTEALTGTPVLACTSTSAGSPSSRVSEEPRGTGRPLSGKAARTSPKPLLKS